MYRKCVILTLVLSIATSLPGLHAEETKECEALVSSARTLMDRLGQQREQLRKVRELRADIEEEFNQAFDVVEQRKRVWPEEHEALTRLAGELDAAIAQEALVSKQMFATLTALQAISGLVDIFCGEADPAPPPADPRPEPKTAGTGGEGKIPPPKGPMSRELLPAPLIKGTWGDDNGTIFQVNAGSFTADGLVRLRVSVTGPGKNRWNEDGYNVLGHRYNKQGEPEANYKGVLYKRKSTGLWVIDGLYQWLGDSRWYGLSYYEWGEDE